VRIYRLGDALVSLDSYQPLVGRNREGLEDLVAPHVGWEPGDWLVMDNAHFVRPRPGPPGAEP
jgi:hypothetical protein